VKKTCALFFVFLSASCMAQPLSLPQQTALHFTLPPRLHEGVTDCIWLRIEDHWHSGRYDSIFPLFFLLTRLDPGDTEAWATGGWFLINAVSWNLPSPDRERIVAKALSFIREGLEHNRQTYELYWELAWIHYRRGAYRQAMDYITGAEKFPHPAFVDTTKAHILMKQGKRQAAIRQWEYIRDNRPEMSNVARRFLKEFENGA